MARTFDFACHDCKVSLWIGQSNARDSARYLYSTPECLEKLNGFMFGHLGHSLVFDGSETISYLDYRDLDDDEEVKV